MLKSWQKLTHSAVPVNDMEQRSEHKLQMEEPQVVKSLCSEFELREYSTAGSDSSWKVCEKGVGKTAPCLRLRCV